MKSTAVLLALGCLTACSPPPIDPQDVAVDATDAADATDAMNATDVAMDTTMSMPDAMLPRADCGAPTDSGFAVDGSSVSGLRGTRYCEVLLANVANGNANIDVYNTFGVSECPDAAWMALDANAIRAETMSAMAILNGPRYWIVSGFENSMLADPTIRYFGCIPMRTGGRIQVPLAGAGMLGSPYTPRTIMRNTTAVFAAGGMVYELVDPMGRIFDMQSYSTQTTPQTEASLSTLGERLTLPTGWTFRTRTLATDLRITTVGGTATVVTDNFSNTYQLSQQ